MIAALTLLFASVGSHAADLTVGLRADVSIDPHYLFLGPNMAMSRHLFSALVDLDENSKRHPGLAESWKPIDDTTWEFKLRRGVKFHDGSEFTAADVAFTIARIPGIPNNPNPYSPNVRSIAKTEIVDPYTVRFTTNGPNPALPGHLTNIFMVSHLAAKDALPADFVSGKAAIGTGPYRFVSYARGDRLVLERNPAYWGAPPPWEKVTFRFMSNDGTRVAALLAGDVELIDYVPPASIEQLEKDNRVTVWKRVSDRVMYLYPKFGTDTNPFLTDRAGKPLDVNPFKDARVRLALSKSINREVLVSRLMDGLAVPASQLIPEGFGGFNTSLTVEPYDPDGARKLLAEAGYPDGFGVTLHCSSDRYVNDAKVCQGLGQMIARGGIAAKVETLPSSVFFPRMSVPKSEFALQLVGLSSSSTGDAIHGLASVIHTRDASGEGTQNWGLYSNPALDAKIAKAVATLDDAARETLLQDAMATAIRDTALVPLYTQMTISATRKGITYVPRMDEQAVVMYAKPSAP